jgi:hypothetical protein
MGDGTEEHPYTREDVLRLIEENEGTARDLDLSRKHFKYGINLEVINLAGIVLKDSVLREAHLECVDLSFAKLERADLSFAHLTGADFSFAKMEGIDLFSAELSIETKLSEVDWGNYVLDEKRKWRLGAIENPYRRLKQWYTDAGMYDIAGKFFYREMEAKRKFYSWKSNFWSKLWSWIMRILCGYGERPWQVFISAAAIIIGAAAIYFLVGSLWSWGAFWGSLYFSVVSFTALGYGSWVNATNDAIRGLGAAESFLGVFMMALFLVTFTRKMTR